MPPGRGPENFKLARLQLGEIRLSPSYLGEAQHSAGANWKWFTFFFFFFSQAKFHFSLA